MILKDRYIDIHSHILPGVDDGPSSMDETIQMLRKAADEGIRTIIATPHYMAGEKNTNVNELEDIMMQVQSEAYKIDKDFKILLGNELYYSNSVIEDLKLGKALTLAGSRYILVEFAYSADFHTIHRGINDFVCNGYIPIIAHIERYHCMYKKPYKVNELVEMGSYMQMNCDSLIGGFLDVEASYNRKLLKNDLVHFIASDSHNHKTRAPMMQKAIDYLRKKTVYSKLEKIALINPSKILEDTYL